MNSEQAALKATFRGTEQMGAVISPGSTAQEDGKLIIRSMIQQGRGDRSARQR